MSRPAQYLAASSCGGLIVLLFLSGPTASAADAAAMAMPSRAPQISQVPPGDSDKTLAALHDELRRRVEEEASGKVAAGECAQDLLHAHEVQLERDAFVSRNQDAFLATLNLESQAPEAALSA